MKLIGILGGMSAASTQVYYQELCRLTQERLGGLHSPELLIRSIDFAKIEHLQAQGAWEDAGHALNKEVRRLESAGADFIILATNTMHKVTPIMMEGVEIPLLHIAEATADAIKKRGFAKPGLIATKFTMEQSFYTSVLIDAGLEPIIPDDVEREAVHKIIYDELCQNTIISESKLYFERVVTQLQKNGADCVILGCTEVGLLLNQTNSCLPVFDTVKIHCNAATDFALK